MSTDERMNPSNKFVLMKDTRGYSCGRCRQRLFPITINVSEIQFQCPACQRVASSPGRPYEGSCNNTADGRVSNVVQKYRNKFFGCHDRQNSDSEKPNSLNWNPSPLQSSSSPSSSRSDQRPRKRALLIGVTYKKWKYRLKGTVNDVRNMRSLLIESFGFKPQNILVLTEDETEPNLTPTKKNIEISLQWLVKDCRRGDSLVFFFSGHGLRQPDFNRDERDGFDETICPVDFLNEGMILDNDINSTIVWPLPEGVTLHSIVDACHSGTILDLVYVYNREKDKWEDNSPPNGTRKHTNGGLAISLSACEDNQMAADTTAFTEKGMNGALTYILIEIVKKHPETTYSDLLDKIHATIDDVNNSGCLFSRVLRSMFHNKILQKPQLSASEPFQVKKKKFIL
ncbi:metacaspase-1-like [Hevea brasiliensis]|uniref:metacaspase-1-like n=1 Tax=Hevea brasiliensis TaxID=3981 RepID=UPI0025F6DC0F|nr:metacaspase-1-like [Hevea brasiliensis]